MAKVIVYEDKDVAISDRDIKIKCYFFPFGNSKTIPFSKIKFVQVKNFAWKGKVWGMNITEWGYWMPGDLKRWDYDRFIAVQTGSSITPSFTCTDMDTAYRVLVRQIQKYRERKQGHEMGEQEERGRQEIGQMKEEREEGEGTKLIKEE